MLPKYEEATDLTEAAVLSEFKSMWQAAFVPLMNAAKRESGSKSIH